MILEKDKGEKKIMAIWNKNLWLIQLQVNTIELISRMEERLKEIDNNCKMIN